VKSDRDSSSEVRVFTVACVQSLNDRHGRLPGTSGRAQAEDQGTAYQAEAEAWRDDRKQHSGRETRKDNQ